MEITLMPSRPRTSTSVRRPARVAAVTGTTTLLAAALFGGVAYADIPGAGGVYTGCYSAGSGTLRVIDDEAGQRCRAGERTVTWSQAGQPGPIGPQGRAGSQGDAGLPATKLFAFVDVDGTLVRERSSGAVSASPRATPGYFDVVFDRDVSKCVFLATTEPRGALFGIARGYANVFQSPTAPNTVSVLTTNSGGQDLAFSFHLAVFC
ncbi:hypothetical protein [Streptomyces sp. NPDC059874]|uniref:hypothetical protein n=1 Tax=Streptomyces sp. NPDC059874 TaxID=3346983 RepID=UPI00364C2277